MTFYIDSISILDLFESNQNVEHNDFLRKSIYETNNGGIFDNKLNKNIYSIEKEINGKFDFIECKLNYIPNDGLYCPMYNGIWNKTIGVIQLLLENCKLKRFVY